MALFSDHPTVSHNQPELSTVNGPENQPWGEMKGEGCANAGPCVQHPRVDQASWALSKQSLGETSHPAGERRGVRQKRTYGLHAFPSLAPA